MLAIPLILRVFLPMVEAAKEDGPGYLGILALGD